MAGPATLWYIRAVQSTGGRGQVVGARGLGPGPGFGCHLPPAPGEVSISEPAKEHLWTA